MDRGGSKRAAGYRGRWRSMGMILNEVGVRKSVSTTTTTTRWKCRWERKGEDRGRGEWMVLRTTRRESRWSNATTQSSGERGAEKDTIKSSTHRTRSVTLRISPSDHQMLVNGRKKTIKLYPNVDEPLCKTTLDHNLLIRRLRPQFTFHYNIRISFASNFSPMTRARNIWKGEWDSIAEKWA